MAWMKPDVEALYSALGESKNSEILSHVLRVVKKHGPLKDALIRRILRNNYRSKPLNEAIGELASEGDIRPVVSGPTGVEWEIAE